MAEENEFKVNVSVGGSDPKPSMPVAGTEIKPNVISPSTPDEAQSTINPEAPSGSVVSAPSSFSDQTSTSVSSSSSPENLAQAPSSDSFGSSTTDSLTASPLAVSPAPENNGVGSSTPGVVGSSGAYTPNNAQGPKGKSRKFGKKKALVAGLVISLLLVGGSVGAYYGYIEPNKPENIWSKALSNTSRGYDKLIEYSEENKEQTTTKMAGNYRVESEEFPVEGSYSFESDQKNSKSSIDFGITGSRIKVEALTSIPETSPYPDVYLKVDGIKSFEPLMTNLDPEYGQMINQIDGQWYMIDRSLFDQLSSLMSAENEGDEADTTFDQADAKALVDAIGSTSKKYVLSSDPSYAVLNASEYVGKETVDGRTQYHYKVKINKDNLKKYVAELKDQVSKTEFFKTLGIPEDQINLEDINKSIDSINDSSKADVWVDGSTKLIRTVRFSKDDSNYVDVGLKYNGGKEFPFYIKAVGSEEGDKGGVDFTATLNTDNNTLKVKLDANNEGDSGSYKFNMTGDVSFSKDPVNIEKPADAKSVLELFGIDPSQLENLLPVSTTTSGGDDTNRKNELKNLQAKIETYYNDKGEYPENLDALGVSRDERTGPTGEEYYVYRPSDGLQTYILSATLDNRNDPDSEDGLYVVESVNQI